MRLPRSTPLEIFPSPVRSTANISLSSAVFAGTRAKLSVLDQQGRLIERVDALSQKGRDYRWRWQAGRMPSGLYIVRVEAAGKTYAKNVIVMR